ncbi:MAG: SUMF1/EgtB/PvdO family nonheme iron enzyme, partial [Mariprofundaceae bacterium]|nr:SUMF1/EgtB/PvdO family nonheme iron enzyme [Mariprofundaceae bacterium]
LMGSTSEQVEEGYRISAAGYGHEGVRRAGWFDGESPQRRVNLPAYRIEITPVTQQAYADFVRESGHRPPYVSAHEWQGYGLAHPFSRAQAYNWQGVSPPEGKRSHPVVLLSAADAEAYAAWLSARTGRTLRLPTEAEWEKAMRGDDGRLYPWGDTYDAKRLNNADTGPFATLPVGSFPDGASVYGVLDGAGQVFEWTATGAGKGRRIVKGGSWDDHGGVCRPAARHSRPEGLKHILIGFRLVEEIDSMEAARKESAREATE